MDLGADRLQLILEVRDNTEVAAATAQRPEQLRVVIFGGPDAAAVGQHDLCRDQVVHAQAHHCSQPADTTAQGEAGYADMTDGARGDGEAVLLAGPVEISAGGPAAQRARRAAGSTTTSRSRLRSIIRLPSAAETPETLCPPPRTEI